MEDNAVIAAYRRVLRCSENLAAERDRRRPDPARLPDLESALRNAQAELWLAQGRLNIPTVDVLLPHEVDPLLS